ncbi:riboflavin kinase [Candidatus Gracilibacteria bacterium]|nr:riboflavin kinase [Candidatus Gracilibacteria bacterium]
MHTNISFSGIVIHGKKLGHTIGYPTANIALPVGFIDDGVYTLAIDVADVIYRGIGTYRESIELFEAHIFDFDTDIYGETLGITLIRKIRDNQKFDSFDALKNQINKDVEIAKQ